MLKEFRARLIIGLFFVFLVIFSLSRISLFFIYKDVFGVLTFGQTLMAFLSGLKFDLATVATFAGAPIFMLGLPVPSRKWVKFWTLIAAAELIAAVFILVSDIIFFEQVKRHIGDEIKLLSNDMDFIVKFILNGYVPLVMLIIAASFLSLFFINRTINRSYKDPSFKFSTEPLKLAFLAVFLVMSVRGWTFHGKPINVVDAFDYSSSEYGNLVLNGVFTSYQSARSTKDINHVFYGSDEAIKTARELITGTDEKMPDTKFPLMRTKTVPPKAGEKFNVVVLFLESWSYKFIDSFSGSKSGATSNFDEIAKGGLMFTNFYANGQRSIFGIEATLTGIPALPGLPYLGKGLEISNITRLGSIVKKNGYSTLMMQTSKRGSYRLEGIASALGFDEYYGRQDYPVIYPYGSGKEPTWGYDYDGLMFLLGRLENMKRPFFTFFFTGTTHVPFVPLDDKFEKFPRKDDHDFNAFLNSLYYSDYSIGEFFKEAKEKTWYENTIFILTADHALGEFQGNTLDDKFKIPLVVYCPKLFNHKKIGSLGSQADLLPTIIELLNIDAPFSAVGKSLMGDDNNRFVLFVEGETSGIITDKGYLKHSMKNRLETSIADNADADAAEKALLSIDEAVYHLLKENRWYR